MPNPHIRVIFHLTANKRISKAVHRKAVSVLIKTLVLLKRSHGCFAISLRRWPEGSLRDAHAPTSTDHRSRRAINALKRTHTHQRGRTCARVPAPKCTFDTQELTHLVRCRAQHIWPQRKVLSWQTGCICR